MKKAKVSILLGLLLLASCSTTRSLSEDQSRLASNSIQISGDKKLSTNEVAQYIRQEPNRGFLFGWNPFLSIYNWSDGSSKGLNPFWEKIGTAPVVYDESLTEESVLNISNHLQYLGYYDSSVKAEVSGKNKKVKVTYKVNTGKRHRIDEIRYDVPQGEFASFFYADTVNTLVKKGDFLSESALEAETVRGAAYFRNLGYYDFNKNNYFFEADTLSGSTVLYYRIRPYTRNEAANDSEMTRYRFRDVRIHYPKDMRVRENFIRKFNVIKPGEVYSEDIVNKTYHRLSALNVFNNVNIGVNPVDSAALSCDISLLGTDVLGFKTNIEMSSNSSGLLAASPQLTLFHKNLFGGGEWFNIGFTGNWQFMPGSNVGSTELGVSASLSLPQALGYSLDRIKGQNIPRTEIRASYNYQNRPEYRRSVAGVSLGYTGQVGQKLFYQFYPLQFNLVKLYGISDSFHQTLTENPYLWDSFEDKIDLGLGGMLYYASDASIVPKGNYRFLKLNFDSSGNLISLFNKYLPYNETLNSRTLFGLPYYQYVKAELQLGGAFRFGWNDNQALAIRLDAACGWAYGNSLSMPFEKQFYGGGASSMRGWQVRTLGPGYEQQNNYFIIPSQTGDLKLELDAEWRFPLIWKLEGVLFAEAGNIWWKEDLDKGPFLPSIAADWGTGVRVNLDFILLRVDIGFKTHDPSREEGQRWIGPKDWITKDGFAFHFGVGYPF